MKTIGILGGMSWESTLGYYRSINQAVKAELGGLHSAQIALYSVNFDPIEKCQHSGDWQETADILSQAAKHVESAGADFLLICTNTMHKVADQIERTINIPLLHIADATGEELVRQNITRVGLLGTAFTMEQGFYKDRLREKFGLSVIIPNETDRQCVHNIIYEELCVGKVEDKSREIYLKIINRLGQQGAQAVILGCTEIGMLVKQADTPIALVDTTEIHAQNAVAKALSE